MFGFQVSVLCATALATIDLIFVSFRSSLTPLHHTALTRIFIMVVHEVILVIEMALVLRVLTFTYWFTAGLFGLCAKALRLVAPLWVCRLFFTCFPCLYRAYVLPSRFRRQRTQASEEGRPLSFRRGWNDGGYGATVALDLVFAACYTLSVLHFYCYVSEKSLYPPYDEQTKETSTWSPSEAARWEVPGYVSVTGEAPQTIRHPPNAIVQTPVEAAAAVTSARTSASTVASPSIGATWQRRATEETISRHAWENLWGAEGEAAVFTETHARLPSRTVQQKLEEKEKEKLSRTPEGAAPAVCEDTPHLAIENGESTSKTNATRTDARIEQRHGARVHFTTEAANAALAASPEGTNGVADDNSTKEQDGRARSAWSNFAIDVNNPFFQYDTSTSSRWRRASQVSSVVEASDVFAQTQRTSRITAAPVGLTPAREAEAVRPATKAAAPREKGAGLKRFFQMHAFRRRNSSSSSPAATAVAETSAPALSATLAGAAATTAEPPLPVIAVTAPRPPPLLRTSSKANTKPGNEFGFAFPTSVSYAQRHDPGQPCAKPPTRGSLLSTSQVNAKRSSSATKGQRSSHNLIANASSLSPAPMSGTTRKENSSLLFRDDPSLLELHSGYVVQPHTPVVPAPTGMGLDWGLSTTMPPVMAASQSVEVQGGGYPRPAMPPPKPPPSSL